MPKRVKFGVQTPPQNTTWEDLKRAWKLIDELGFDSAWTFDHFLPILSDPSGPCFEGWISLTALAAETSRVKAGVLVTGNTYRHPAVLAKMAATFDHATGGRLIMGLGAGWFEAEHEAYGIPFYTTAERINRLDEATQIIKSLWTERMTTFTGRYYQLKDAYAKPKPIQKPRPPIMIGGSGEKLTLRVVARHADQWNTFGSPEVFAHKISVLRSHCEAVGRDFSEIEVSWAGLTAITDSTSQKEAVVRKIADAFGAEPDSIEPGLLVGSSEEIRRRINDLKAVGVAHFILLLNPPFDRELLRRFAGEIIPRV